MKKSAKTLRSHCPVNFGLEAFGDRWALLILRDIIFRGKHTYGEFLKSEEGFATNILASRLEHLIAEGILQRQGDVADGRKALYTLTEKGLDLIPVIFEIMRWSAKHDAHSLAKRIPKLMTLIEKDQRAVSAKTRQVVSKGEGIVEKYAA
jgi:DNA-binding HxlR family transcriptional regulator